MRKYECKSEKHNADDNCNGLFDLTDAYQNCQPMFTYWTGNDNTWHRRVGGILGAIAHKGEPIQLSPLTNPAVIWRNVGDLIAINSMFLALVYVPLSTIGAVIQAVPLLVTAAAALFLGEQVGLRRVSAIFVGFLGTLLIIQPGANTFDITATLVLVAALGMALRDIATKLVRESFSTLLLTFYSSFLFIFSGIILLLLKACPAYLIGVMSPCL